MKKLFLLLAAALFLGLPESVMGQIEAPPIDSFQLKTDDLELWYTSASDSITFDVSDASTYFGDSSTFLVIPRQDILDNEYLSYVVRDISPATYDTPYSMDDTTYFGYDDELFERDASYICTKKRCSRIQIGGYTYSNVILYHVAEVSSVKTASIDSPWRRRIHYYAVADSTKPDSIYHCVTYWSERGAYYADRVFNKKTDGWILYKKAKNADPDELTISPIPAGNTVNVSYVPSADEKSVAIDVYDIQGRRVLHKTAGDIAAKSRKTEELDVVNLASGTYTLKLSTVSGPLYRKFTIQH